MPSLRLSLWCALGAVGCASARGPAAAPSPPDGGSGARLVARYVEHDGARAFVHFLDSSLDAACTVTDAAVGTRTVCEVVPSALWVKAGCEGYAGPDVLFTPHAEGTLVRAFSTTGGGGTLRVGRRVADGPAALGIDTVRCAPLWEGAAHEVAEVLAPDALAAGQVVAVPLAAGLDAHVFEGDDGSRALLALFDTVARRVCTPTETEAGLRCGAPSGPPVVDEGLRDPTCSEVVVREYSVDAVAPLHAADGSDLGLHRFTPLPREAPLARADGSGCAELAPGEVVVGRHTLFLAEPYPVEAWPVVEVERFGAALVRATPRLPEAYRGVPDARPEAVASFEEEGTVCQARVESGGLACVPAGGAHVLRPVHLDDRCAGARAHAVYRWDAEAGVPRTVSETVRGGDAATAWFPVVAAWEVRAPLADGPHWFQTAEGGCARAPDGLVASVHAIRTSPRAGAFPALRLVPR